MYKSRHCKNTGAAEFLGGVNCNNATFPYSFLGHAWYLFVSNPDRCLLPYFGIEILQDTQVCTKIAVESCLSFRFAFKILLLEPVSD